METSIVLSEKFSNNWKNTFYSSLGLAIVIFVFYLNTSDVIWTGILRLTAFISFSLSVFCLLKIMEGGKRFRVAVNDQSLHIVYMKNEKIIHEEVLHKNEIESIYRAPSILRLPIVEREFTISNTWVFNIKLTDTRSASSLFKFGGKALAVDEQTGKRLENFFKDHNLYSHS